MIIEGARVNTARACTERALSTAMDSVFADYYGPLWEEYHLFGYYPGEGSQKETDEEISELIKDYMSYTLEPDQGLHLSDHKKTLELYNTQLDSIALNSETKLMDYQGKLLINEAVEYMKYNELGNGMELLLNKLSLLQTPEKLSYIYEEKQKAEEKLVEVDKGVLKLMMLLDGLKTSKRGIVVTKKGQLKTTDYFVKKICFGQTTKESVGINQESVFLALRDSYVDPTVDFEAIQTKLLSLEQVNQQIEAKEQELKNAEDRLSQEREALRQLRQVKKKTKEDKQEISETQSAVDSKEAEIRAIRDTMKELETYRQQLLNDIGSAKDRLSQLVSSIKPIIEETALTIDDILIKTESAAPLIKKYEKILGKEKTFIEDKVYTGLEENLAEMKKYISVGKNSYDFNGMKSILKNNLQILTHSQDFINQGNNEFSQGLYNDARSSYNNAENIIRSYQISGLTLDYSTLVLDKSSQENPLDQAGSLLESGITSLVMDPDKISDKKLAAEILPSEIAAMSDVDTDYLAMLTSFFKNAAIGDENSGMRALFESFGDGGKILAMAGDGVNKLAEHFLYQEYLKEHFGMYEAEKADNTDKMDKTKKPSVLDYEQEYLLVGKLTDKENLSSVIARTLFLRTILDFVSLVGDSTKRNEAEAAAIGLVGFTGLPFLVSITQVLIMLCWALAEAMLDVCTLMLGKEVPILKKKVILELPELFMINRGFLEQKARALTDTKETSLSYPDYLRIFLLLKSKKDIAYRSLDLMQEDIRLRYDADTFSICNCIFGYEAAADYSIAPKFIGISFVKRLLNISPKNYHFTAGAGYCY